jgi:hypothetical protein
MLKILTALVVYLISLQVNADVLVRFDNPLDPPRACCFDSGEPQAMSYVDPRMTASPVESHGVVGVAHIEMYQTNGWSFHLDEDKYISFTVAPASGNVATYQSLDIDLWQVMAISSFALRSSFDGFVEDLVGARISEVAWNPTMASYHMEFASPVTAAESVEFRLYFYGGAWSYLIATGVPGDGLAINGSVAAVPEPASVLLILVGLACSIPLIRAKKRPR